MAHKKAGGSTRNGRENMAYHGKFLYFCRVLFPTLIGKHR